MSDNTRIASVSQKAGLAASRDQRLAELRARTGRAERFKYIFACANSGQEFEVTFARTSPDQKFRCEAIEKLLPEAKGSVLDRLKGKLRSPAKLTVAAHEFTTEGIACAYCSSNDHRWVFCSHCHAAVCSSGYESEMFHCRCGYSYCTAPLNTINGSAGSSPAGPALTHSGRKLLR